MSRRVQRVSDFLIVRIGRRRRETVPGDPQVASHQGDGIDGAVCRACPLRSQCIAAKGRQGRRVLIHPQEALLQEARALQQSAAYDEYRARRVVVEHRLARLAQLGIRQARYFGRVKTRFQVYLAAQQATASSSMSSTLWSPMRRPITALSGSDNYGL